MGVFFVHSVGQGEVLEPLRRLCQTLLAMAPKRVTRPFDYLPTDICRFSHPGPRFFPLDYFDTG